MEKIGILGLPFAGKKTILKMLSGTEAGPPALIDDARLEELERIYRPARSVKAGLHLELLPDLERANTAGGKLFPFMEPCGALCFVIRSFEDSAVCHPEGSVDPARDFRHIESELVIQDLALAEKRIERIEKEIKTRTPHSERELRLMKKIKAALEDEKPLRALDLTADEKSMVSGYAFLTLKPAVCVLNTGERGAVESGLDSLINNDNMALVGCCAKLEAEIEEFPRGAERNALFEAMNIETPASVRLKNEFLRTMGLISFFTATGEEIRQWLIPAGSTAGQAAGKIHSDMEQGFIKADVLNYGALIESGSEKKAAGLGKKMLKGRDYTVTDGDILNIRFNT